MAAKSMVKVRDIMKTSLIIVDGEKTVQEAAKMMAEHSVGSLIVADENGHPVGIITDRDVVTRVVAKSLSPKLKVGKVMSSPLATVPPDIGVDEVAKRMSSMGVRRFVVMQKGKLLGIISSRDIVTITPTLMEVIFEKAKLQVPVSKGPSSSTGVCDGCGISSDILNEHDGQFLCPDCLSDFPEEGEAISEEEED